MVDVTRNLTSRAGLLHKPRARSVSRALVESDKLGARKHPPRLQGIAERHVMTQLFTARFLAFFCGDRSAGLSRTPWMLQLPNAAGGRSTVEMSLQAAALAYYAAEVGHRDAMIQSSQVYTQALGLHSTFVGGALMTKCLDPAVASKLVASNLILAYFEAIQCTTLEGYGMHISAAATFLEMAGPALCVDGPLNQLFFAVRSQMASISSRMWSP